MTTWPSRSTVAAAALLLATLIDVVVGVVVAVASSLDWGQLVELLWVTNVVIAVALALAGSPLALLRPRNSIGWLLLAAGFAYASTAAGTTVLAVVAEHGWTSPLWRVVATVTNGAWAWALALFLPLALLLFPDGRLPGARWRGLAGLLFLSGPVLCALGIVSPDSVSSRVGVDGYFTVSDIEGLYWLFGLSTAALIISYLGALAALIVRFRRGSATDRRQLLYPLLAVLVVAALGTLDPVLPDSSLLILPILLIPISIAVAVLHHRLLDIELLFSRSLLYVLLTFAVIAAYAAVVTVFEQAWSSATLLGPSVAATLVIAVAFNPARVWLQRRVDRAVYGARRDPVRAVAEVGARLGQMSTSTDAELVGVLEGLCAVMRLPSASISVGGRDIAAHGQRATIRHAVPLQSGEEQLGELVVGLRGGESRLSAGDERVIALLVAPIAVAVQARLLAKQLRQSREQVITAREEERRRLRRDLHDGLGPVLTGVVLKADAARRLALTEPERTAVLLTELRDETTAALRDIRLLVYDLRPPALDSLGLIEAVRETAMVFTHLTNGSPVDVSVDAAALPPLPAAVEVAAYRIVTEALTNISRHSSASTALVTITAGQDGLLIGVHDDGVNLDGAWEPGVGLTSIRERVAELGGRCVIQHDRTGGRVDAYLPLAAAAYQPTPTTGSARR